jgi:hypothetical protein
MTEKEASCGNSRRAMERFSSLEARYGSHVAHSIDMVGALPGLRENVAEGHHFSACTESWMLNLRLLAEFLAPSAVNSRKDFTCSLFEWPAAQGEDAGFLDSQKELASAYLAHFSVKRAPQNVEDLELLEISLAYMVDTSSRVLQLLDLLVDHLCAKGNDAALILRNSVTTARANLKASIAKGP